MPMKEYGGTPGYATMNCSVRKSARSFRPKKARATDRINMQITIEKGIFSRLIGFLIECLSCALLKHVYIKPAIFK